jgi:hypothetical protein
VVLGLGCRQFPGRLVERGLGHLGIPTFSARLDAAARSRHPLAQALDVRGGLRDALPRTFQVDVRRRELRELRLDCFYVVVESSARTPASGRRRDSRPQ